MNAVQKSIYVVIPGFNEQAYLGRVLEKVNKFTQKIIFVDDGSTDNTAKIAAKYTSHVLTHQTNLGKGAAMLTGCEYAFNDLKADAVVFMDSDDQHDAAHLPEFFKQMNTFDVVFGVRYMGANMPLFRLLNLLYGAYIPDIPSGYKGVTKKAFKKIKWNSSGYEVEMEIAVRVAQQKIPFSMIEMKAIYHDKDKGMTILDAIHITLCLLQWRLGL
jgi:glycosyltransferase involved in cell wall biosynthesis